MHSKVIMQRAVMCLLQADSRVGARHQRIGVIDGVVHVIDVRELEELEDDFGR